MRATSLVITLASALWASAPASALDPGLGGVTDAARDVVDRAAGGLEGAAGALGEVGGTIGAGAGASVGGVSAGVGAEVGLGGGSQPGGAGPTGSASGSRGPGTGGTSAGKPGASDTSPSPSAGLPGAAPATEAAAVQLPWVLLPVADPDREARASTPTNARAEVTGSVRLAPLAARPGTPTHVIAACREAIATAASPYGAARVEVVSAGRSTRMRGGGTAAPVEARILYARSGKLQVRQSRISCRLNAAGDVVAAL